MMTKLFDVDGPNLDLAFRNLRAGDHWFEKQRHDEIEAMWATYEPYADPDFRHGFARDVDGRFWEMYLGCTLLAAGRALLPVVKRKRRGGQPDLCVLHEGRRIWIEAIAPGVGAPGPDQIPRLITIKEGGQAVAAPVRQAQLRTSSALLTKANKIEEYIRQGVIAPEDTRIIAISASRFGVYIADQPLPLIMTVLFPIGDSYVKIDRVTGDVVEAGYHPAPLIGRQGGAISREAFLNERFAHVSGVIWSRAALGNLRPPVRPITYVHNPLALVGLPTNWGIWDREFVATQHGDAWEANDILASGAATETR